MIRETELRDAIAECHSEKNPDSRTCIKLAAYYTILNNLESAYSHDEPPQQVRYKSGSEFSNVIQDKSIMDILEIMDDLMDALKVLSPKLYRATLSKLKNAL